MGGQFSKPALLFSGGKDSIAVAWLARKAFWPGPFPFPLVHIDTGHNFPETLEYRDGFVRDLGATLVVGLTYVALNLFSDLMYRVLDPRVR